MLVKHGSFDSPSVFEVVGARSRVGVAWFGHGSICNKPILFQTEDFSEILGQKLSILGSVLSPGFRNGLDGEAPN